MLSADAPTSMILGWLYEGLIRRDRVTFQLEPNLAKELPQQVDKEGLVWEVTLRDDVTWFDGKPVTADDVVFTINKLIYNERISTSWRSSWQLKDKDPKTGRTLIRKVKVGCLLLHDPPRLA